MSSNPIEYLKQFLQSQDALEFAVLVGSQAIGTATPESDWDIALQWKRSELDYLQHLAQIESLRQEISKVLNISSERIDLIDVPSTKLAMREVIANKGVVLMGEDSLPWIHFLNRTWRDLEDYYWDEIYVA